jgi:hypothetical protein
MIGKSYGYVIFDDDYCTIALTQENAIKYIQNKLLEKTFWIEYVKGRIIDEGYPKANYSDDFIKDFIRDMLIQDPYYFETIYYSEVPLIED